MFILRVNLVELMGRLNVISPHFTVINGTTTSLVPREFINPQEVEATQNI